MSLSHFKLRSKYTKDVLHSKRGKLGDCSGQWRYI